MHLTQKPSSRPLAIAWPDTYLCCEWSSYGTHTTFPCPSLALRCCSFLMASTGCLESPCLGSILCSMVWEHLSLAFDSKIQSLTSSVWISAQSWQHTGMLYQERRCRGTSFPPESIYADNCDTLAPDVSLNLWYPTWCAGYGTYSSAHAHLDPFVAAAWSIVCTCPHSSPRDSIVPWWRLRNNSKWVRPRTERVLSCPFYHSGFVGNMMQCVVLDGNLLDEVGFG